MQDRKLDTSISANKSVADLRVKFDRHLDDCADCQPRLCHMGESLWRSVCLTAMRTQFVTATQMGGR